MSKLRTITTLTSVAFVVLLYFGFIKHELSAAFLAGACLVTLIVSIHQEYKYLNKRSNP